MANNVENRELGAGRGRLWSHQEKTMLKFMKAHNYHWNQIAIELGRKPETVRRYWYNYQKQIKSLTSYFDFMKKPFKTNKC